MVTSKWTFKLWVVQGPCTSQASALSLSYIDEYRIPGQNIDFLGPGMVVHTFDPDTWEAKADESLWIRG